MTRAQRKDGAIRVVQQKTGIELWIREHRDLTAELALAGPHMSLLTRYDQSAFDSGALSLWFADAIEKAGLPVECVMHGLRNCGPDVGGGRLLRARDRSDHRPPKPRRDQALHRGRRPEALGVGGHFEAGTERQQNGR